MKRVFISIFCFLIIFTLLFQVFPIKSNAVNNGNFTTAYYDPSNDHSGDGGKSAGKILAAGLSLVQWAGVAVAIIMLLTLGVKYLSGGVDDKSTVKKNTVTYVIAAGIFFGGSVLVTIIKTFVLGTLK